MRFIIRPFQTVKNEQALGYRTSLDLVNWINPPSKPPYIPKGLFKQGIFKSFHLFYSITQAIVLLWVLYPTWCVLLISNNHISSDVEYRVEFCLMNGWDLASRSGYLISNNCPCEKKGCFSTVWKSSKLAFYMQLSMISTFEPSLLLQQSLSNYWKTLFKIRGALLRRTPLTTSYIFLILRCMFSISSRNSLFSFIFSSTLVTEYMMVVWSRPPKLFAMLL